MIINEFLIAQDAMHHPYFEGLRQKDENRPITAKLDVSKSKSSLRNNIPGQVNHQPSVNMKPPQAINAPQAQKQKNTISIQQKIIINQSPGSVEKGRSSSKFGKLEKEGPRLPQPSIQILLLKL